jgi:hypothetical protein
VVVFHLSGGELLPIIAHTGEVGVDGGAIGVDGPPQVRRFLPHRFDLAALVLEFPAGGGQLGALDGQLFVELIDFPGPPVEVGAGGFQLRPLDFELGPLVVQPLARGGLLLTLGVELAGLRFEGGGALVDLLAQLLGFAGLLVDGAAAVLDLPLKHVEEVLLGIELLAADRELLLGGGGLALALIDLAGPCGGQLLKAARLGGGVIGFAAPLLERSVFGVDLLPLGGDLGLERLTFFGEVGFELAALGFELGTGLFEVGLLLFEEPGLFGELGFPLGELLFAGVDIGAALLVLFLAFFQQGDFGLAIREAFIELGGFGGGLAGGGIEVGEAGLQGGAALFELAGLGGQTLVVGFELGALSVGFLPLLGRLLVEFLTRALERLLVFEELELAGLVGFDVLVELGGGVVVLPACGGELFGALGEFVFAPLHIGSGLLGGLALGLHGGLLGGEAVGLGFELLPLTIGFLRGGLGLFTEGADVGGVGFEALLGGVEVFLAEADLGGGHLHVTGQVGERVAIGDGGRGGGAGGGGDTGEGAGVIGGAARHTDLCHGVEVAVLTGGGAEATGSDLESIAAAGAGGHVHVDDAFEGLHLHLAAGHRGFQRHVDVDEEVEAFAAELRVRGDADDEDEVTGRAGAGGGRGHAHAGDAETVAGLDAAGDVDFDLPGPEGGDALDGDATAADGLLEAEVEHLVDAGSTRGGGAGGGEQALVVEAAELGVVEDVVGFLDETEALKVGGGGAVGVVQAREDAVRLVDQLGVGGAAEPEDFVIVLRHRANCKQR